MLAYSSVPTVTLIGVWISVCGFIPLGIPEAINAAVKRSGFLLKISTKVAIWRIAMKLIVTIPRSMIYLWLGYPRIRNYFVNL
jgi:hypothetical protein